MLFRTPGKGRETQETALSSSAPLPVRAAGHRPPLALETWSVTRDRVQSTAPPQCQNPVLAPSSQELTGLQSSQGFTAQGWFPSSPTPPQPTAHPQASQSPGGEHHWALGLPRLGVPPFLPSCHDLNLERNRGRRFPGQCSRSSAGLSGLVSRCRGRRKGHSAGAKTG